MSKEQYKLPELLAPAGNFEKLVTAIHYGADAVYLGGRHFSLRARAGNFSREELCRATQYAHEHGVLVYVTVNIFARNSDLDTLASYLFYLREIGINGLIIADPGILLLARQIVPELPIHLSTQSNVTNQASARFWTEQGVKRLNLARELSLDEIRTIRETSSTELEIFVHGALCISYSGRCLLSTYFTGRDANQGDCAHPCRYSYRLVEEKRPGLLFPVEEDERGTYIFNSRDLCLLNRLPELVASGVDSLKIEGRMKSMGYVGAVVRLYRAALNWLGAEMAVGRPLHQCTLPPVFQQELSKIGTRGWTENFINGPPSADDMLYDAMRFTQQWVPVGIVLQVDPLIIDVRNVLEPGDLIEYLGRNLEAVPLLFKVISLSDEDGNALSRANPGNRVVISTEPGIEGVKPHALLRKKMGSTK